MDKDYANDLAAMRQQIMALASIIGVLVTALREGGLMTESFEALLSSELAAAAATQSEQAQMEWCHGPQKLDRLVRDSLPLGRRFGRR